MRSSKNFRSLRRRPVYGLPTLSGLGMFAIIGLALWFSIHERSALDQWFAFLMILLVLLHLLEINEPFRYVSVQPLPMDTPYAGEAFPVSLLLVNPSPLATEELYLKFAGAADWTRFSAIGPESSVTVSLVAPAMPAGKNELPELRLQMFPSSRLFRLWKVFSEKVSISVLPHPVDHLICLRKELPSANDDEDLSELEPIRDPRLFSKMDQKLYLKTGLHYQRIRPKQNRQSFVAMHWKDLHALAQAKKTEQFSFWLKQLETKSHERSLQIEANTPFFLGGINVSDLHQLKKKFSGWLYD